MNRNRKSIVVLLIVFSLLIISFIYFAKKDKNTKALERPANVSRQAIWIGGVDGGHWYKIDKTLSPNIFKIKIFNDYNGDVIIDSTFTFNSDCKLKQMDLRKLIQSINGYDGEKILLNYKANDTNCYLILESYENANKYTKQK